MEKICVKYKLFKHIFLLHLGWLGIFKSLPRILELPISFYLKLEKNMNGKGKVNSSYVLEK